MTSVSFWSFLRAAVLTEKDRIYTMTDRLVEISREDWPKLKELYSPDGSKSYIAYTTIDNYIRWFEQNTNVKHVKMFSLNGDFSDGTFVVTDRCSAFADTFNESFENLRRLLQLVDYSKGYCFLSIRTPLRPVIREALAKVNVEVVMDSTTLLYYLPKEDALKFQTEPPQGIDLRPLTDIRDIEKVNSVWPHCNPNSLPFLQRMAQLNTNIGAFKHDETLVAWLLRLPTGLLGALQTDENYYGHGYGSLVARYVSKSIAKMGHDIYAGIFEANTPSRTLFGKIGFKSIGEVHWIMTKTTWSPADE